MPLGVPKLTHSSVDNIHRNTLRISMIYLFMNELAFKIQSKYKLQIVASTVFGLIGNILHTQ